MLRGKRKFSGIIQIPTHIQNSIPQEPKLKINKNFDPFKQVEIRHKQNTENFQELFREANTIASKSEVIDINQRVIEIKTDFFTSMSHELRTPLTSIIGYNELLAENALSKKQTEYQKIIKDVSYSMLDIVNDLLDTSKIEKKNIQLHKDNFNINETYIKVCKSLRSIVNKEVEFTFETDFQNCIT